MDGVPGFTQTPIPPAARFVYEFTVPDPGTYFFHPHAGVQLDRGLYGVLIVVWGDGPTQGLPGISDSCIVAASPVRENPDAALQALLAIGPPRPGPLPLFVYADRSGSRRALKVGDQQAAIAALSDRRLRFAAARNDANFTWISLSSPRGQ